MVFIFERQYTESSDDKSFSVQNLTCRHDASVWNGKFQGYLFDYFYPEYIEKYMKKDYLAMHLLVTYDLVELKPLPKELAEQLPTNICVFMRSKDVTQIEHDILNKQKRDSDST